jgi:hypothetical protein
MQKVTQELRNNPLWKEASAISEYIFDQVDSTSSVLDEKWNITNKIRNSANDMMLNASMAVASSDSAAAKYDWNSARKSLFAMQTMYLFACKQSYLDIEPEWVVRIDKLLQKFDDEFKKSVNEMDNQNHQEMEQWLQKYKIWQQIQGPKT